MGNKTNKNNSNWDRVLNPTADWALSEWTSIFCKWMKNDCGFSPDVLLDVGVGVANSEAWIFKEIFENIEVIGFEPQKERYEFLKEIYPGKLFNLALASRPGFVEGFMGHLNGESDFILEARDEYDLKTRFKKNIECESIDSIITKDDLSRVFLWADIEGSELEMLKGAVESMLKDKIIAISLEINLLKDATTIVEFLSKFDYYPVATTAYHTLGYLDDYPQEKVIKKIIIKDDVEHCDILFFKVPHFYGKMPRNFFEIIDER